MRPSPAQAPGLPLRVLHVEASFNKALALNLGAAHARGRTLFFLDCDLELEGGTCAAALKRVAPHCVVVLDRVVESAPSASQSYPH